MRPFVIAVRTLVISFVASAAFAQGQCAAHDEVLATLEATYGETVQVRGVQNNGTMVEITANTETGTWTALVTDATGMTCGAAGGDLYMAVPQGDPA